MQKQYDLICSLASCILILCHTKTSDFGQRCITRHQFPLFLSQQCVHLKKSCFRRRDTVKQLPHLVPARCTLALGQGPAARQCQPSALVWLQHTENAGSSQAGSSCFPGVDLGSGKAPSRLQGGVFHISVWICVWGHSRENLAVGVPCLLQKWGLGAVGRLWCPENSGIVSCLETLSF